MIHRMKSRLLGFGKKKKKDNRLGEKDKKCIHVFMPKQMSFEYYCGF